jgi:hypothetical protein
VPVLARLFEEAGMSTVIVTNMPYWAERIGVPRALGVELPFGHILGKPGDREGQRGIILEALDLLTSASGPGTVAHSATRWPGPHEEALQAAHPTNPPPIMGQMGKHIGNLLRNLRRADS